MREVAQLVQGSPQVVGDRAQLPLQIQVLGGGFRREAEPDSDRHQRLLGAVVEIALQLLPLAGGGRCEPRL